MVKDKPYDNMNRSREDGLQHLASIYNKIKKILRKQGIDYNLLHLIRDTKFNIILKGQSLSALLSKMRTKQGCQFSPLLLNIIIGPAQDL